MKRAALLLAIALLATLLSCQGETIEIRGIRWQINVINDKARGRQYENLSLFVRMEGEDTLAEIAHLFLIQDQSGLFWEMIPPDWSTHEGEGGEVWVGKNNLRMADFGALPIGLYRVQAEAFSGKRAEDTFLLRHATYDVKNLSYPEVSLRKGRLGIGGDAASYKLWIYDEQGKNIGKQTLGGGTYHMKDLFSKSTLEGGKQLYTYTFSEEFQIGIVTGPLFLSAR